MLKTMLEELIEMKCNYEETRKYIDRIQKYWDVYSPTIEELQIVLEDDETGPLMVNSLISIFKKIYNEINEVDNQAYLQRWFQADSNRRCLESMLTKLKDTFYILYNRNQILKNAFDARLLEKELCKRKGPMSILKNREALFFVNNYVKFSETQNSVDFETFLEAFNLYLVAKKIEFNEKTMRFMINKYLDADSSGTIDAYEIEDFFANLWAVPRLKSEFCKDINTDPSLPLEINAYTLSRQLLVECDLECYFTQFNSENICSKAIRSMGENEPDITLSIKKSSLVPLGDCCIIAMKIADLNKEIKLMEAIEDNCANIHRLATKAMNTFNANVEDGLYGEAVRIEFDVNICGEYVGEMLQGKPHGYGQILKETEDCTFKYVGLWEHGELNIGVVLEKSHSTTKSEFRECLYGSFTFPSMQPKDYVYELSWDKKELKCKMHYYELYSNKESLWNLNVLGTHYEVRKYASGSREILKLLMFGNYDVPTLKSYYLDRYDSLMVKYYIAKWGLPLDKQEYFINYKKLATLSGYKYNKKFNVYLHLFGKDD